MGELKESWDALSPGVQKILRMQCEAIDADPETVNFRADRWWTSYTWPEYVELEFQKKLSNELMHDSRLRRDVMCVPSANKKMCEQAASEWVFLYGWTMKHDT